MAGESRWIFTRAQLVNTPSRKYGIDSDKELNYRQQTANFIQDMGQRLQVTQLCINTGIVYMHRFYMFHSFTKFGRNNMAAACLFLAAKVEEQPRKLEHVIKVGHMCLHREAGPLDMKSETYLEQAQELVVNENILLQTLGFDITVDHPHTHVVKTCTLVRASKDLAQTSYFLATNSLHLTSMCLQYKPTVVACVCIHLACKWSNWEIPRSSEGREWFWYTDHEVTMELLEELTQDFLTILDKCPSKLKKKILTWKSTFQSGRGEGGDISVDQPPPMRKSKGDPLAMSSISGSSTSAVNSTDQARPSSSSWGASQSLARQPSRKEAAVKETEAGAPAAVDPSGAGPSSTAGAMPLLVPPATDPQRLAAEAGMRRVKTEPVLNTLTPKEYRERRERERQAAMRGGQGQHAAPQASQPKPPPAEAQSSQDAKDRHHMDIFSHTPGDGEKPARPEGSHGQHGRGEHARSRERPHGDLHRSQGTSDHLRSGRVPGSDRERLHDPHRSRDQYRNKEFTQGPQQHRPVASSQLVPPPPPPGPPLPHTDATAQPPHDPAEYHRADHLSNAVDHSLSNNGHGGQNKADSTHHDTQGRNVKQENVNAAQSHSQDVTHNPGNKDLKIKLNLSKGQGVSPSSERKDLKMKIKLPGHSSSPVTSGEGLKLKLDLKSRHPNDERHTHSRASSGEHSTKAEYQLTNQGSNPLKLVLSKGKTSGESPGSGHKHHRSTHHHHHHSGKSGSEKSHSRKRPHGSPQDPFKTQTVSSSRGHSSSHGHPNKMSRSDSFSNDMRLNQWGVLDGVPANGSHSSSPGIRGVMAPKPAAVAASLEHTKRQLQQLIDIKQAQLGLHPVGGPLHPSASAGPGFQPPLPPMPPNSDGLPPPPPPTEPPPLPSFHFN